MNREDLGNAIKAIKCKLGGSPVVSHSTMQVALEAMLAQLDAMEPEVWVPPDGMIVEGTFDPSSSDYWIIGRSTGKLDIHGELRCVGTDAHSFLIFKVWRPIPHLCQFIPFSGNECPAEAVGKWVDFSHDHNGRIFLSTAKAKNIDWSIVTAWRLAE